MDEKTLTNILLQLTRIADALEANQPHQEYRYPLTSYRGFDWAAIGAEIMATDSDGPSVLRWRGHNFKRRASSSPKYGKAVWFSRANGRDEDGTVDYESLIKFSDKTSEEVEPIPAGMVPAQEYHYPIEQEVKNFEAGLAAKEAARMRQREEEPVGLPVIKRKEWIETNARKNSGKEVSHEKTQAVLDTIVEYCGDTDSARKVFQFLTDRESPFAMPGAYVYTIAYWLYSEPAKARSEIKSILAYLAKAG